MKIIQEYRAVCDELAVAESKLRTAQRTMARILSGGMRDIGSIDYSTERVQSGPIAVTAESIMQQLQTVLNCIRQLEGEIADIQKQKIDIESALCQFGDLKRKVLVMRTQGYSNFHIACELKITKRHVERLFSSIQRCLE